MNIPGLTDRYKVENLKEMSLEELLDMQQVAEEKHAELQMQLECLQASGGVSRQHAANIVDYLPEGMVLESFTDYVTQTNYGMTCESLSTAAKVALSIAVVAGFGALVFFATRTASKSIEKSNDKIEEVYKRVKAADEQLKREIEQDREAVRAADLAKSLARESLGSKFAESSPNNYLVGMLRNIKDGRNAPGTALRDFINKLKLTVSKDYTNLLVPAVDAVVKYAESGGDSSAAERLLEKLQSNTSEDNTAFNGGLFQKFVREQIIAMGGRPDNVPADVSGAAAALKAFAMGNDLLSGAEVKQLMIDVLKADKLSFKLPPLDNSFKALDEVVKLTKDLPKQEKRLQGIKERVPSAYHQTLSRYIEMMKASVQTTEAVISLINMEIQAFNRIAVVVGRSSLYEIESMIDALDSIVVDEASSNKIKSAAIKARSELGSLRSMLS